MNTLEAARNKMDRLNKEQRENEQVIRKESEMIPFGQPNIAGRPNIYKGLQRKYEKSRKLYEEQEKQANRVEMLEKVEGFKVENELLKDVHAVGKSSCATVGARMSVNNLEYFKAKLQELEEANEKAKAYNKTKPERKTKTLGAEITKLKRKIEQLEAMKEKDENKTVSERAQNLIDEGAVTQWKKKPIYYFVKGLRKVAVELDQTGNFVESTRYRAWSEEDKEFLAELLKA